MSKLSAVDEISCCYGQLLICSAVEVISCWWVQLLIWSPVDKGQLLKLSAVDDISCCYGQLLICSAVDMVSCWSDQLLMSSVVDLISCWYRSAVKVISCLQAEEEEEKRDPADGGYSQGGAVAQVPLHSKLVKLFLKSVWGKIKEIFPLFSFLIY